MQSLVDGLCVASVGSKSRDITDKHHKLLKLYPLVTDQMSDIFGYIDHNQNWVDGIFTSTWRKAARVSIDEIIFLLIIADIVMYTALGKI